MKNENRSERLLRAVGGVGSDLVDRAETYTYESPWRKWVPVAACLLVTVGLTLAAWPWLGPKKDASLSTTGELSMPEYAVQETHDREEPEPATEEEAVTEEFEAQIILKEEAQKLWLQPRKRLIYNGYEYYDSEAGTTEDARDSMGASRGTVEQADDPALQGAEVYTYGDPAENPQNIWVWDGSWYRRYRTYRYPADSFCTADWVRQMAREAPEDMALQLAGSLDAVAVAKSLDFSADEILTGEPLLQFFLATLDMEQAVGIRTEELNGFLWEANGQMVIPMADVQRQLIRYLDQEVFDMTACEAYDETRNALILPTLELEQTRVPQVDAVYYDETHGTLAMTLLQTDEKGDLLSGRQYVLQVTEAGCIYESITTTVLTDRTEKEA